MAAALGARNGGQPAFSHCGVNLRTGPPGKVKMQILQNVKDGVQSRAIQCQKTLLHFLHPIISLQFSNKTSPAIKTFAMPHNAFMSRQTLASNDYTLVQRHRDTLIELVQLPHINQVTAPLPNKSAGEQWYRNPVRSMA